MAKRKRLLTKRGSKPRRQGSSTTSATRAGSNAGRGFRFQDAVAVWLAVEMWGGQRAPSIMIPEGGDDVELRGASTTFVQIKSRRNHLGNYSESAAVRHIRELWGRCIDSTPQPDRMELILERNVVGFASSRQHWTSHTIDGPIRARLASPSGSGDLVTKTSITVAGSPQEASIKLIVDLLNCSPVVAQMCFAELLIRVGDLADSNGRLSPKDYRGLSISDTEWTIHDVLATTDVVAVERAIRDGVCEPVNFLTPLYDTNFYLGVDVEPGHVAAGLVSERPRERSAVVQGIDARRAVLVVGPSGAGKSAIMWGNGARASSHSAMVPNTSA